MFNLKYGFLSMFTMVLGIKVVEKGPVTGKAPEQPSPVLGRSCLGEESQILEIPGMLIKKQSSTFIRITLFKFAVS